MTCSDSIQLSPSKRCPHLGMSSSHALFAVLGHSNIAHALDDCASMSLSAYFHARVQKKGVSERSLGLLGSTFARKRHVSFSTTELQASSPVYTSLRQPGKFSESLPVMSETTSSLPSIVVSPAG